MSPSKRSARPAVDVDRTKRTTRIVVDGVELTVTQIQDTITVTKIVGRDRERKIDITSGRTFVLDDGPDPTAIKLVSRLKSVAALKLDRCTCDYRRGFSDHASHCRSVHVARCEDLGFDDD